MNLRFLGDALDHWKGSIFESLHAKGLLHDLAVDPMLTDPESWTQEDFELYARLLRIGKCQILQHRVDLKQRVGYFGEIQCLGDLFLDPDIGINTGKRKGRRHIQPAEIGPLLDHTRNRLLIIYQHMARQASDRVNEVICKVEATVGRFSWCSYKSGTVAMLFLSRESSRTLGIAQHFKSVLGRQSARVSGSEAPPGADESSPARRARSVTAGS